ncbi:MAG: LacI family DNA-binding transcriptional regulator, partial [Angustibacter sp.]
MTARLADIARAAGVSEATVSRVLNAKPSVAEGTRQTVLTALDVLGYERPAKLRRNSAGLVGLITPELTNPIFPAFAQEIETLLARSGYTPVLGTQTPGGIHEDDYTEMLLERQVSGIIFVSGLHADSTSEHGRYEKLTARRLPIVLINGFAADIAAPFVSCADSVASELAVQHLSALGHRHIGLAIGPERFVPAKRKILGFAQAMARYCAVTDVESLISVSLFTVEGGQVAATKLLDQGCTAIVCGSDLM